MQKIELRLFRGNGGEMETLQKVLESAPDYSWRITGMPPAKTEAEAVCTALPEGKSHEDKFVYGIYAAEEMVGCIDLIRAYPIESTAFLGLLLLAEPAQRSGLGSLAYALLEAEVRSWKTCRKIRLAVLRANDIVLPFWQKQGFRETGETKPYRCQGVESELFLMEKLI